MKKFIICLILVGILIFTIPKAKTDAVECWWGVLYPELSYIGFEEDDTQISTLNEDYIPVKNNSIHTRFWLIEWFNSVFNFSPYGLS